MMMAMLAAGGMPVLTDARSSAPVPCDDFSYYQFVLADAMAAAAPDGRAWIPRMWTWAAIGKAVKILNYRVDRLPPALPCRLIVLQRGLADTARSFARYLLQGVPGQENRVVGDAEVSAVSGGVAETINEGVEILKGWDWPCMVVTYEQVMEDAELQAIRVSNFLGGLDVEAMVAEQQAGAARRAAR